MKLSTLCGASVLALSAALMPVSAGAAIPGLDTQPVPSLDLQDDGLLILADRGRGRGGDDDGRGRGRGGDDDDRHHDDDNDRHDRDRDRDRSHDDDDASGSGRDKPRIPGGSGCDDPGDVREHAECRG